MIDVEVALPQRASLRDAERLIESHCASEGLRTTMKGTLSKYPGCVHWHLKKDKARGTLEITLWREKRRLWFSIQSGRTADWIPGTIERLKPAFESGLT